MPNTGTRFALDHDVLNPLHFWTAAYVHLNDAHLYSNLVGYALAVIPTYVFYRLTNRRRAFWVSLLALLVVVPPLSGLGSNLAFRSLGVTKSAVSRGFSGIVSAIVGLLLGSVLLYLWREYETETAVQAMLLVVLVTLAPLGLLLRPSPLMFGALMLGFGLVGSALVPREIATDPAALRAALDEHGGQVLVLGYCVLVVAYMLVSLFPASAVQGDAFTNVFGHGVGLATGISIGFLTRN